MLKSLESGDSELNRETFEELYQALLDRLNMVLQFPAIAANNATLSNVSIALMIKYFEKLDSHRDEDGNLSEGFQEDTLFDMEETHNMLNELSKEIELDGNTGI